MGQCIFRGVVRTPCAVQLEDGGSAAIVSGADGSAVAGDSASFVVPPTSHMQERAVGWQWWEVAAW